jgi:iron-sulfur cluster assembly accessory protein
LDSSDSVFKRDEAVVVVDDVSMEFVRGATVDFVQEMIRSSFAVVNNPNSEAGCGCGASFSLKMDE